MPFQLLQYAWEWHGALEEVRADLQELIDARLSVGLTPAGIARLTGGLRAVVGFGTDNRTDEVRRRYGMVLDIVNRYLPPRVAPLETWEHTKQWATPSRLNTRGRAGDMMRTVYRRLKMSKSLCSILAIF